MWMKNNPGGLGESSGGGFLDTGMGGCGGVDLSFGGSDDENGGFF